MLFLGFSGGGSAIKTGAISFQYDRIAVQVKESPVDMRDGSLSFFEPVVLCD